jgi:hypothetical protein
MSPHSRRPRSAGSSVGFVLAGTLVALATVACGDTAVLKPEGPGDGAATSGTGRVGGGITLPDASASNEHVRPAACIEEAFKAEAVPVDLMLVVDASWSMAWPVPSGKTTKWAIAKDALTSFLADPRSAGLGVGLQLFPQVPHSRPCTSDAQCGTGPNAACVELGVCALPMAPHTVTGSCDPTNTVGPAQCTAPSTCAPGLCSDSGYACHKIGQDCGERHGKCVRPRRCAGAAFALEGTNQCALSNYEEAAVPIGLLPGHEPAITQMLRAKIPGGDTPMRPAVEGALKQLRTHLAKNPERRAALILATDGLPNCLATDSTAIADLLSKASTGVASIPSYVVAVFHADEVAMAQPQIERLAMAGGTGTPFILTTSDDLAKGFQDALNTIRHTAVSCEFKIPPSKGDDFDLDRVNVRFTPASGVRADLPYVRTMANCDPSRGGWHYDVDPATGTPTSIRICPTSCETIQRDLAPKVELVFTCLAR